MAGAETAGIVAIAMLLGQGLIELLKFLIGKFVEKDKKAPASTEEIKAIVQESVKQVILHETQAGQLRTLYEMHMKFDNDGTPVWYVPRSWAETNKDIADRLYKLGEVQSKTITILERILERLDK